MVNTRIHLVRADLETCFALLGLAAAQIGVGDFTGASATFGDIEAGYLSVKRFMADSEDIATGQRDELALKLEGIRVRLKDLRMKVSRN